MTATVAIAAALAACSDGSENLPQGSGGATTAGAAGSGIGLVAGSSGQTPTNAGAASSPTAGSDSPPSTGGGGGATGGSEPGTGGSAAFAGMPPGGGGTSGVSTGGSAGVGGSGGGNGVADLGPFKVLIISTALEFPHPSISDCQKMVADLGLVDPRNGWTTKLEGDELSDFTADGLKDYSLIFSCNPTGRVFSGNPKLVDKPGAMKAFQDFIETEGKGFAGVHSASDFEKTNGFPWFTNTLMGAYFSSHDSEGTAGSVLSDSQNSNHPVLAGLSSTFSTKDEWYRMNRDPGSQPGFKILQRLAADSRPLTWVKEVGQGRMFYTARGHAGYTYAEAPFRDLVKNGILWATKRIK